MDQYQLDNWLKVKEHLEQVGATDNFFYTRACAIAKGEKDPHEFPKKEDITP